MWCLFETVSNKNITLPSKMKLRVYEIFFTITKHKFIGYKSLNQFAIIILFSYSCIPKNEEPILKNRSLAVLGEIKNSILEHGCVCVCGGRWLFYSEWTSNCEEQVGKQVKIPDRMLPFKYRLISTCSSSCLVRWIFSKVFT